MAKHRQQRSARSLWRPGAAGLTVRGGALAVIAGACVVAGVFSYTAATNFGARADIAGAARSARPSPVAGRSPDGSTSMARAHPARRPVTASPASPASPGSSWHAVPGSAVTAVGDSVLVASTPALQQALPGIYIDAQVGRQFYTGLSVIAALKARGLLRRIVVVDLGTNGTVTWAEISRLFAEIGKHRRLVLVNTFEDRSWEYEVNSTLAAAARDHPDVELANWYATVEHRTYLLWSDGIHPQPAGGLVYARMLKAAVEKAGNPPGPPAARP